MFPYIGKPITQTATKTRREAIKAAGIPKAYPGKLACAGWHSASCVTRAGMGLGFLGDGAAVRTSIDTASSAFCGLSCRTEVGRGTDVLPTVPQLAIKKG